MPLLRAQRSAAAPWWRGRRQGVRHRLPPTVQAQVAEDALQLPQERLPLAPVSHSGNFSLDGAAYSWEVRLKLGTVMMTTAPRWPE